MFFYIHQKCQASLLLTTAGSKRGHGELPEMGSPDVAWRNNFGFETVLRVFFLSFFFAEMSGIVPKKNLKMTSLRPTFFLMAICFIQKFSRTNLYEAVCRAGGCWFIDPPNPSVEGVDVRNTPLIHHNIFE